MFEEANQSFEVLPVARGGFVACSGQAIRVELNVGSSGVSEIPDLTQCFSVSCGNAIIDSFVVGWW